MRFKRICAGIICISVMISLCFGSGNTVYANDEEITQTEPLTTEVLSTEPPPTEPPSTEPPSTQPPSTEPPLTESPSTEPLSTEPPMTEPRSTEPSVESPPTEPEQKKTEPVAIMLMNPGLMLQNKSVPDANPQDDDLSTVSGQGITFRLFNYSTEINKTEGGSGWRAISPYFTFRNSKMENGSDPTIYSIPSPTINADYDQDGYKINHATVERVLDGGYPILDLTRNAEGNSRPDPGISGNIRSLRYLFSAGDHAVTAYAPTNTILQQSGSHYWYNSAEHAVDYDLQENRFRLRGYAERNSITADYGGVYGDFLPFTYTGGVQQGSSEDGVPYHVDSDQTDYWFGMTMQVNFFQSKGGRLGDQNMIFRFSGDDDVWVFVDNVLVLDLGGTHGTVNGSINFATGEVLQYLSWGGANATEAERTSGSASSFPTTIRACFDAAGRTPNGGWSTDGQTFADFSEHTLKFFYLERGSAVANCSLDFRLPTLPDESLTVTKDLISDANQDMRDYLSDTVSYCFRVMKADGAGNATDEPFLTSGMTYSLLENGTKVGTGTVGADHCFRLRVGQSAQFTQMLRKGNGSIAYVVEELLPDDLTGQYSGVDYLISGIGGETNTGHDPAACFTAYKTSMLSADQTQTVTFRNRVDTGELGTLKITKQAAPGTVIPSDLYFQIQVKLGGNLLPVGTRYSVDEVERTVETAGVLLLRVGETAVIEQGILGGTDYQITELSASFDGYRPTYTGIVQPAGEVSCTADGATGIFPLAATIHITIVNADYDFAVDIPLSKKVLDFKDSSTFSFSVEHVERNGNDWVVTETRPEIRITVSGENPAQERIIIGYRSHEAGVFYYRIREIPGDELFLYDTAVFLVEVTVADGKAEITGIQRNGVDTEEIAFTNRAVTTLTVTKTITGGAGSTKFPFRAEIYHEDEPFFLREISGGNGYTVEGNVVYFSLGHGERITLPFIPINAVVKVEEYDYEGFQVFTKQEGTGETQISGSSREVLFQDDPLIIHFTNQSGFRLPNTGGTGTAIYNVSGAVFSLGMGTALLQMKSRKRKQKDNHPKRKPN